MTKFEELKEGRANTVGELINLLSKFPRESKLDIVGADSGGYDQCSHPFAIVSNCNGIISIAHNEYEIWHAYFKKEISEEEHNLLLSKKK